MFAVKVEPVVTSPVSSKPPDTNLSPPDVASTVATRLMLEPAFVLPAPPASAIAALRAATLLPETSHVLPVVSPVNAPPLPMTNVSEMSPFPPTLLARTNVPASVAPAVVMLTPELFVIAIVPVS
jgi:hypothetical protein